MAKKQPFKKKRETGASANENRIVIEKKRVIKESWEKNVRRGISKSQKRLFPNRQGTKGEKPEKWDIVKQRGGNGGLKTDPGP